MRYAVVLRFWLLVLLLSIPSVATAASNVYVQNNTQFPISVSVAQTGTPLGAQHWSRGAASIAPGMREKVLGFNRDTGITSGKNFFFDTKLHVAGSSIVLKQQLHGNSVNSSMWQSVAGPGFQHPWFDDRGSKSAEWHAGDTKLRVLYRAYFAGTEDDIEYIIQSSYSVESPRADTWHVLAYNIYMRPDPFQNGQGRRADLLRGLHGEYPNVSRILGNDEGLKQDGGVIIVSRWPIVAEDRKRFTVCEGSDCLAKKGVLYAKILRDGRPLHIFGSHTQAYTEHQGTRAQQFREIKDFIDRQAIPPNEPVLIGGDLNVDKRRHAQEFNDMLRILNAQHPTEVGPPFSFDPAATSLPRRTIPRSISTTCSGRLRICARAKRSTRFAYCARSRNGKFWPQTRGCGTCLIITRCTAGSDSHRSTSRSGRNSLFIVYSTTENSSGVFT